MRIPSSARERRNRILMVRCDTSTIKTTLSPVLPHDELSAQLRVALSEDMEEIYHQEREHSEIGMIPTQMSTLSSLPNPPRCLHEALSPSL